MPSRKEIQWSQLKVGGLVLLALSLLIGLIFLMTGSSGGLFAHRIKLRCYFPNAGGLKEGAVVTLEGVTIGNVVRMRVVPDRNPFPVEVVMQVGEKYLYDLHTDSVASIQAAGVLGDSYVDIESKDATGPEPRNNSEIRQSGAPTIQSMINSSQVSIEEINHLVHKLETLIDTLNTSRGTVGELINDPTLKKNVVSIATNLQTVTQAMASDRGTIGKLVNDDTLYTKLNTAVDNLNSITADLNAGKGTAGKLLKDEQLYQKLDTLVAKFGTTIDKINAGQGTIGQLMVNPQLYESLNAMTREMQGLVKDIRANPKRFLTLRLAIF